MLIAHLGRDGAARKVLGVNRIPARIPAANALDREFPRLSADFRAHNAVRHCKARVRFVLMNALHNLTPNVLMEGIAAVSVRERLVLIAAGPNARRIVGCVPHKPDVHVVARGAGLAGAAHIRRLGARTGRVDIDPAACKLTVRQHGLLQGIREQEGRGILDDAALLRTILE